MPGGSGREKPWSSASWPKRESSRRLSEALNMQTTPPEPGAPPAGEEEVLDEVEPVGKFDLASSSGEFWSRCSSDHQSRAMRRGPLSVDRAADDAPAPAVDPESIDFSRSAASNVTCSGIRMPAWHDAAESMVNMLPTAASNMSGRRRRMDCRSKNRFQEHVGLTKRRARCPRTAKWRHGNLRAL